MRRDASYHGNTNLTDRGENLNFTLQDLSRGEDNCGNTVFPGEYVMSRPGLKAKTG